MRIVSDGIPLTLLDLRTALNIGSQDRTLREEAGGILSLETDPGQKIWVLQ